MYISRASLSNRMRFSFLGETFGAGFFTDGLPFLVAFSFAVIVVFGAGFADGLAVARVVALTVARVVALAVARVVTLAVVDLAFVDLAVVDLAFVDLAVVDLAVARVRADAEVVRELARDDRDALATPRALAFFALAASRRLACLTSD
jgi:hypothetical protein